MFNIVLVTIDSLRADHVGCITGTDPEKSLTPYLDEWSKGAFTFTSAISQSSHTSPSFLAILSGCYPCRYGDWFSTLSKDRQLISVPLRLKGYTTCAFNSNPYISGAFGFNRGFDFFEDNVKQISTTGFKRKMDLSLIRLKTALKSPYVTANTINRQVFTWKEKSPKQFFLWVHYMDVHGPYIYKKGVINRITSGYLWHKALERPGKIRLGEKMTLSQAYREKVKYMDYQIKLLLDMIDSDNTIVIIVADHGDLFGEHGSFGHPLKLYDGLLHVPLLIKMPSFSEATGKKIERAVRSMDISPTILDMLGLDGLEDVDGESLFPLMKDEENGYSCEHIISEVSRSHLCVRKPPWKLIVNYQEGSKELYNLVHDPNEENNLADSQKELSSELEQVIQAHLEKYKPRDTHLQEYDIDDEIKTQLRALGYMD